MIWTYTLISVLIISLISVLGAVVLFIKSDQLKRVLLVLVAFSTGALLGDAFIHLIPEAVGNSGGFSNTVTIGIFSGLLLFFVLEKFLRWRHCHDVDCKDHNQKHLGMMNLVGDATHNFIDGLLIGASFLVSVPLGITTTIAVAIHEIPQELGDFGVLLHSGYKPLQAIKYNLLSALTAIIGAVVALLIGSQATSFIHYAIPITAGGFIYIALSGLVPELHKEESLLKSTIQLLAMIAGVGIMYTLLLLE